MPHTVPNQKIVCIHKTSVTENFLQISIDDWMNANKTLTPYGLQLYLYLASNANNYNLALSPVAAQEYAGIKNTSFHKYLKILEIEGYLVWRKGNLYDFYTSPRDPKDRTHPDEHFDGIFFDDNPPDSHAEAISSSCESMRNASRSTASSDESHLSPLDSVYPPSDKEIDNRYIDNNRENTIDKIDAGKPRTPASPDAEASGSPSKVKRKVVFEF